MLFSQWLHCFAGRMSAASYRRFVGRRGLSRWVNSIAYVAGVSVASKRSDSCDLGHTIERVEDRALLSGTGTVQFTAASGSFAEDSGGQIVDVSISGTGVLDADVVVNITSMNGTAGGADYSLNTTSVTFMAGTDISTNPTMSVSFSITNDRFVEGDESFSIDIGTISTGGGDSVTSNAPMSYAVTITDNESATLDIAATSSVTEAGDAQTVGVVTLTITGTGTGTFALGTGISITADVTQSGGTATSGTDYTAFGTQTVTFSGGAATGAMQSTTLTVTEDVLLEGSETVGLTLGNLGGSSVSKSLGTTSNTTTISDNESATLDIATTSSVTENGGAQTVGVVTITITGTGTGTFALGSGISITADVTQSGGTATSGTDYTAFGTQTVTFSGGASTGATQDTTLTVTEDVLLEGSETVGLTLGNLGGSSVSKSLGNTSNTTTISDNESATLDIATTSSVTENGGAQTVGVVTLTIMGTGTGTFALGTGISITADVTQSGGTATSGTDYTAFGTQTVTFNGGASTGATRNTTLSVTNDRFLEAAETVGLSLGNLGGSSVSKSLGNTSNTTTINDNESATVAIAATSSATEAGGAQTVGMVTLTITGSGSGTFSVGAGLSITADVTQTSGSATSGSDYSAFGTQTVTFAAGTNTGATRNTTLTVTEDVLLEGSETVGLTLGNLGASGTTTSLGNSSNTTTISDNESATLGIATTSSVTEAGGAQTVGVVTLTITGTGTGTFALGSGITITADVTQTGGSATSGTDYTAFGTQTVTFSGGASTGATQDTTLTVTEDVLLEGSETVGLTLGNLGGSSVSKSLGNTSNTTTISDNESATLDIAATSSVTEGGGAQAVGVVTLTITGTGTGTFALGTGITITADVTRTGGTSTDGVDYNTFGTQTVTFSGGATTGTTQTVTLTVINDRRLEGDETANLTLGNLGGSTVSKSLGNTANVTTITDNEVGVINFQADQNNAESVDPTIRAILTITPNGTGTVRFDRTITVTASEAGGGSATQNVDYQAFSPTVLTFSPGVADASNNVNSSTATLDVVQDRRTDENPETVNFSLGSLSTTLSGTTSLSDTTHTATITDDDSITIAGAATVNEASTYTVVLTVNLSPAPDVTTFVTVHWGDGTADDVFNPPTNGTYARTHVYTDGMPTIRNITVDLTEDPVELGGGPITYTNQANAFSVTVLNVAPTLDVLYGPVT